MNIEQTRTAIAELAVAGPAEPRVFDSDGGPKTRAARRTYNDQLMMGVVLQLSDLETRETSQKRKSMLIAAISAFTLGLTGYILFG